jgi:hypothetical protein
VEDVSGVHWLAWLVLTFAVPANAAALHARPVTTDTTTIVVTKLTVVAYLVIPEGAVDSHPDLAVLADDWNVAMATLGDSLAAHGIAFALATGSHLRVRTAGRREFVFDLRAKPAAGYVYARPRTTPRLRRGPAELRAVLAAARAMRR